MLSVGDVVQPGALGNSYGIGPYTVVPTGAGAPMGDAVPAFETPGATTSANYGQPAIAGAGINMPGALGAVPGSIPDALQSSLPSSAPGATPSDAASAMGALPQAPIGSASAPTGFPNEQPTLPAGAATDGIGSMDASTSADSGLSGQLPSLSSPTRFSAGDAPAAFDPSSVVGGQTAAEPTGPANALATSGRPIGQSPDSFDVVMKILKGQ